MLDLNTIIPMPADIPLGEYVTLPDGMKLQTMSKEEYAWKCDNWGTKWHPSINYIEASPTRLCLVLKSAWCPPTPCLNKLCEMYPDLCFSGTATNESEQYERLHTLQLAVRLSDEEVKRRLQALDNTTETPQ
jgi:hypothetical protein